jgi:protein involved in polysaccharide export with SLBB domain
MLKISQLLLALVATCLILPSSLFAQETVLKTGQSFGLRITGVPSDEISVVSQKFTISNAGTVRLPYLKIDLAAAGLNPTELARKIEAAYRAAEIYTQPSIQIDVSGGVPGTGGERFVSVIGEVKTPRSVTYTPGMTLLDAIAQSSGFTDFADTKKVKLTRGDKVTFHRLSGGEPAENIRLQPNDIVTVKPSGRLLR